MIHHLTAIWKFRHFLLALVRLDLRLRYRRSVLGIGWSLLNPLAMTAVFVIVFCGPLGGGQPSDYAPSLLLGLAVWNFFRDSACVGCKALIANEAYIRQSPLPFGLYPLRTILGQSIHSAIALAIGVVAVIVAKSAFSPFAIFWGPLTVFWAVVPALLLALVLGWAVATVFAFINVYFQDTQHLLEVGAMLLFFLTPIMYPEKQLIDNGMGFVVTLNPVNLFMDLIRKPLLYGTVPDGHLYASAAAVTVVFVGLAAGTIAWLQKRVIFHL
jgi:ABC-type polysaccharide/polyol phosphate export permease